jgi:hypothetical protein
LLRGSFDRDGRPRIEGIVLAAGRGSAYAISFVVDTGADRSSLNGLAAAAFRVPGAPPTTTVVGVSGQLQYAERAVHLVLREPGVVAYGYDLLILIAPEGAPPVPSILGQDILRHLAMTHDPTTSTLTFEVRHADLALAL